jgi:hypothetical protein
MGRRQTSYLRPASQSLRRGRFVVFLMVVFEIILLLLDPAKKETFRTLSRKRMANCWSGSPWAAIIRCLQRSCSGWRRKSVRARELEENLKMKYLRVPTPS